MLFTLVLTTMVVMFVDLSFAHASCWCSAAVVGVCLRTHTHEVASADCAKPEANPLRITHTERVRPSHEQHV